MPILPPLAAHIWEWWPQVNRLRNYGMAGPERVTRESLRAWADDEGLILDAWERRALLTVDDLYLAAYYRKHKA